MHSVLLFLHIVGAIATLGVVVSSFIAATTGSISTIWKHLTGLHVILLTQAFSGIGLVFTSVESFSPVTYCVRGALYFAVVSAAYVMLLQKLNSRSALVTSAHLIISSLVVFALPLFLL